jgi:uncharacterized membrane protein YbhN (UPF0104 family)
MKRTRRHVVATVATVVVVAVAFAGFLPQLADVDEVRRLLSDVPAGRVALVVLLALLNLLTYPWLTMASLPGLRLGAAVVVTQASTAVANTVPAGAGVGVGVTYAMLSRYGYDRVPIALSITSTGIANAVVRFALPLVAVGWLAADGDAPSWAWHAAQVGLGCAVVVTAATLLLIRRPAVARAAATLRGQRGWLVVGAAAVSHLALYGLFLGCLAAAGLDIAPSVAFAVFATVRLGLTVPLTPGGVGIAEAGYAAALAAAGAPAAPAVAAVLLFRGASYLLPIPLGFGCWLAWRRAPVPPAPSDRTAAAVSVYR